MYKAGILTLADRAALAAYCQADARWTVAEERLKETPALLKKPSGSVQQSPWPTVANKQMDLMARFMPARGLTPAASTRVGRDIKPDGPEPVTVILRSFVSPNREADHFSR